jgi:hypothetical protein
VLASTAAAALAKINVRRMAISPRSIEVEINDVAFRQP